MNNTENISCSIIDKGKPVGALLQVAVELGGVIDTKTISLNPVVAAHLLKLLRHDQTDNIILKDCLCTQSEDHTVTGDHIESALVPEGEGGL